MCVFLHITKRGKCVCVKDSHLLEHIPHIFRPSAQLAPVYLCVIFSQSWQLWPPFISGFKAHVIYHYRLRCCSLIIALNESLCRNSPQLKAFQWPHKPPPNFMYFDGFVHFTARRLMCLLLCEPVAC